MPDELSPQELYVRFYARIMRVVTLMNGDEAEAEDFVQDASSRLIPSG